MDEKNELFKKYLKYRLKWYIVLLNRDIYQLDIQNIKDDLFNKISDLNKDILMNIDAVDARIEVTVDNLMDIYSHAIPDPIEKYKILPDQYKDIAEFHQNIVNVNTEKAKLFNNFRLEFQKEFNL
jgi:hypothetical protein